MARRVDITQKRTAPTTISCRSTASGIWRFRGFLRSGSGFFGLIVSVHPGVRCEWRAGLTEEGRDVLYLLGEYGQDVNPEGCRERFEAFVGVPPCRNTKAHREWFL